jgi:small subunit ribosomal protein S17
MNPTRGRRRSVRGVVVSDAGAKTITVKVSQRLQHPKYGKMLRRTRKIRAHDEADEARVGDTVEIIECRPMSRTKRWRLVQIVARGPAEVGLLPGAVPEAAPAAPAEAPTPAAPDAPPETPPAETTTV